MVLHRHEASAATSCRICKPFISDLPKGQDTRRLAWGNNRNRLTEAKHAIRNLPSDGRQFDFGVTSPLYMFAEVLVEAEAEEPSADLRVDMPRVAALAPPDGGAPTELSQIPIASSHARGLISTGVEHASNQQSIHSVRKRSSRRPPIAAARKRPAATARYITFGPHCARAAAWRTVSHTGMAGEGVILHGPYWQRRRTASPATRWVGLPGARVDL